jgi:hypothetical protein
VVLRQLETGFARGLVRMADGARGGAGDWHALDRHSKSYPSTVETASNHLRIFQAARSSANARRQAPPRLPGWSTELPAEYDRGSAVCSSWRAVT